MNRSQYLLTGAILGTVGAVPGVRAERIRIRID